MAQHFRSVARIIFCILLLPFAAETSSQEQTIRFGHVSLEEGLSHTGLSCVLQDSKGFLWFGTIDGLNRYDGYHCRVYRNEPGNANSLSHSYIRSLCEDRKGTLWIGTMDGLNKFDRLTEDFVRFQHDPADPKSLGGNGVMCIYEDKSGTVWIGTTKGLDAFDRITNTFTHYKPDSTNPKALSGEDIRGIAEDRSGTLWIATEGDGLNKFDRSTNTFIHYKHDPGNPESVSSNDITAIAQDRSGMLWIGTRFSGVNKLDPSTGSFTRYKNDPKDPGSLSHNEIWENTICVDHTGRVLIGTYGGGLNVLDPLTGRFIHHKNIPNNSSSLSDDHVMSIIEDNSGTVWIGTEGAGLSKIDPFANRFFHFKNPESPASNNVWAVTEDHSGMLWIGTETEGVYRFNRATKSYTHFKHDPKNSNSLSHDYIFSIIDDKSGAVWIGSKGGLDRFDPSLKRFTNFKPAGKNPKSSRDNFVYCIHEDGSGTLWVGTQRGLDAFDRSTSTFTHLDSKQGAPSGPVLALCEDRLGSLWIGSFSKGVYELDRLSNNFIHFENDPNNPRSLSANDVVSIYGARNGTVWVATFSGGVNRFDRLDSGFVSFTTKEGLPTNSILAALGEDSQGNLWFGTIRSISRLDPRTRTFMNLDESNGLENGCNQGAWHMNERGEMFLGSSNGISWFYPDSILRKNQSVAPVVITEFRLFNKPVYRELSENQQIELSYADNFFSLEFALLDFSKPAKNQYAYKMEGFNKDWIQSGSERLATYTQLDPGEYTFRVKGSNGDGVWNEKVTSVRIVVTPPWWKTWWFRSPFLLACLSAGSYLYHRRVSGLKEDKLVQQQFSHMLIESQEAERKRIARELHDGIGQSLLIIKNDAQSLLRSLTGESKQATDRLTELSSTASEAIDEIREITSDLRPFLIDKFGLAEAVRSFIDRATHVSDIRFSTTADSVDGCLSKECEMSAYRLIQESVNNITKHSAATEASILLQRKDGHVLIVVRDNGKGFEVTEASSAGRRGFGLHSISERVRILNGTLTLDSAPGQGTTVKVEIPCA